MNTTQSISVFTWLARFGFVRDAADGPRYAVRGGAIVAERPSDVEPLRYADMAGLAVVVLGAVDPAVIPALGWAGERLEDDAWEDEVDSLRRYLDDAHIPYRFDVDAPPPAGAMGPFIVGRAGGEGAEASAVLKREARGDALFDVLVLEYESADFSAPAENDEPRIVLVTDVEKSRRPALRFAIVLRRMGASVVFETGEAEWEDHVEAARAAGADWIVAMDAERILNRDAAIAKLSDVDRPSLDADGIRDCYMDLYRTTPMSE